MFENLNLSDLMKDAEEMKKKMEKIEVTGESGAGAVTVTITAKHRVKKINISDDILTEDKSIIEELIAGACNDAVSKIEDATKNKMMNAGSIFGSMMNNEEDQKE